MKKITRVFLTVGVTLVLSAGAVLSYLQAQPVTPLMPDLTLANLEAMAVNPEMLDDVCESRVICPNGGSAQCSGKRFCSGGIDDDGKRFVLCDGVIESTCL